MHKTSFSFILKKVQQAASQYTPALRYIDLCPVVFCKGNIPELFTKNIEQTCSLSSQCSRSENSEEGAAARAVAVAAGHRLLARTKQLSLDCEPPCLFLLDQAIFWQLRITEIKACPDFLPLFKIPLESTWKKSARRISCN